uniref:Uncharacterized protein n=1 Tax=Eutreptiella gymnastica TaxID=73025 RepID=A0A7S4LIJ9_9EUGL
MPLWSVEPTWRWHGLRCRVMSEEANSHRSSPSSHGRVDCKRDRDMWGSDVPCSSSTATCSVHHRDVHGPEGAVQLVLRNVAANDLPSPLKCSSAMHHPTVVDDDQLPRL